MQGEKIIEKVSSRTGDQEAYTSVPPGYKPGKTKYIVITGSVISGVGKGTFSSALGNLMKLSHGLRVAPVKFDGYLNYDAGTLNPYRHGEVFVLEDGTECDLDLGTYERMLNKSLTASNYLTAGKIFKTIIDKERAGKYLGRDVQFIPHVTGEIKFFLRSLALESKADIVLVEVGGTVGDIENSYFIEAMRELAYEEGKDNTCFVNVVYILEPGSLGEQKSKAAQLGTKSLMSLGIQPNIIMCRAEKPVKQNIREKISVYSNVPLSRVIDMSDVENIHMVPLSLKEAGVDQEVCSILGIKARGPSPDFKNWQALADKIGAAKKEIVIGMTGKYTGVHDSYMSILKALEHTASYFGAKARIKWIETSNIKNGKDAERALAVVDGMIVPGGFGARGTEGKMLCVRHARESGLPFLGLCLGLQMAVIEFARNVCGMEGANSTELDPDTKHPVIDILPEQKKIRGLGGTMRLGGQKVIIKPGTLAHKLYKSDSVVERFRHRFEVNPDFVKSLEKKGIVFSGTTPNKRIMQIMELPEHPFFIASQFHPEFTSRPLRPNPLFRGFVQACVKK
ncbi:MAG: CTP synthase [Candidatus Aenigmatarchaeota archaeon]